MQHTIYFEQTPLIITSKQPDNAAATGMSIVSGLEPGSLRQLIKAIEQEKTAGAILVTPNIEHALDALKEHFTFIQAAGGLVQSDKGNILLIFRKGKWDLPKGKLDPGEDLEQCAVREVEEETGLNNIQLKAPICRTFHTYYQDGQHCLKESHWYLMEAPEQEHLSPQTEEDIEQAIWVAPSSIEQYMNNTHRSVADVLHQALAQLQG